MNDKELSNSLTADLQASIAQFSFLCLDLRGQLATITTACSSVVFERARGVVQPRCGSASS